MNIFRKTQMYLLLCTTMFGCSEISAQEYYNGADTINVRIQGDSIVYRQKAEQTARKSNRDIPIRYVPDSVVARMQNDKVFEYANDPAFWKKEPPPDNSALFKLINWLARSPVIKWLLYIFLAAIILFAIYQVMVVNDFFLFTRPKTKAADPDKTHEELTANNLDDLLEKSLQEKNYRVAVRCLYLKTLQSLHERRLIVLDARSTNHDYISQLKQHNKRLEFIRLTNIYEYAWYGEYALSEQQFELARNSFDKFISRQ